MILNKIANSTKKRVESEKEKMPLEKMKDMAKKMV